MVLATWEAEVGGSPEPRKVEAAVNHDRTTILHSLGDKVRAWVKKKRERESWQSGPKSYKWKFSKWT